jgi:hypothetical protein
LKNSSSIKMASRFAPDITADDERIVSAIEAELAK